MMLIPRLVRRATEFGGRFLLVMLNTNELGCLAREHGVNSLSTVKLYRRGKVVDTLHGAESETLLRAFISRHVSHGADSQYASALQAYRRGDLDKAVTQAAEAALAQPDNPRLTIDLIKLHMLQKRYIQADDLINSLASFARRRMPHPLRPSNSPLPTITKRSRGSRGSLSTVRGQGDTGQFWGSDGTTAGNRPTR